MKDFKNIWELKNIKIYDINNNTGFIGNIKSRNFGTER